MSMRGSAPGEASSVRWTSTTSRDRVLRSTPAEEERLGLALALQLDRATRLDIERLAQGRCHRGGDVDPVRFRGRLQPAGHVHGVAPDVVDELPGPDHAGYRRAGVHTHADAPLTPGDRARGFGRPHHL